MSAAHVTRGEIQRTGKPSSGGLQAAKALPKRRACKRLLVTPNVLQPRALKVVEWFWLARGRRTRRPTAAILVVTAAGARAPRSTHLGSQKCGASLRSAARPKAVHSAGGSSRRTVQYAPVSAVGLGRPAHAAAVATSEGAHGRATSLVAPHVLELDLHERSRCRRRSQRAARADGQSNRPTRNAPRWSSASRPRASRAARRRRKKKRLRSAAGLRRARTRLRHLSFSCTPVRPLQAHDARQAQPRTTATRTASRAPRACVARRKRHLRPSKPRPRAARTRARRRSGRFGAANERA